ncbi:MAG TPA: PIN domain-containing protein [Xanthomonadales bacterium]|nr:PIN domain-containing protein [Xanthomonadales bacterium]
MPDSTNNIIFIDTSAIAAIMNKNDQFHKKAITFYNKILEAEYSLVLTNFIIAETHALLLKNTHDSSLGLKWLGEAAYQAFHVIRPDETDEKEAIKLLTKYDDKAWSLTDALSFRIMEKFSIAYYFSFDGDFKQIGKFLDITDYLDKN